MPGMLAAALWPLVCAVHLAHLPLLRGSCRRALIAEEALVEGATLHLAQ